MRRAGSYLRTEFALALRRGENLLVTMMIPGALLVFLSSIPVFGIAAEPSALLPGTMSIALMAAATVSLGISLGFERQYKVLKRLGSTPLTRGELIASKLGGVMLVEALQMVVLAAIALALGANLRVEPLTLLAGLLIGTLAFGGLGALLGGTLRAETNLAVTNAAFVAMVLLGGAIVPVTSLPSWMGSVARLTPVYALSEWFRGSIGGPWDTGAIPVLVLWALLTPVAAAAAFRWE